ncbi:Ipo5, partial [Symbiodinium necroappetens]
VKLIDFDAAQKLQHPQQIMDRMPGNLAAVSPERAEERQYLGEDSFQVGWTFYCLIRQIPHDPAGGELRARVKPLLDKATSRPNMHATLQRCSLQVAPEPGQLQIQQNPTLLTSSPASDPLTKLWLPVQACSLALEPPMQSCCGPSRAARLQTWLSARITEVLYKGLASTTTATSAAVVEYIEEEAWVDQCIDFLVPHTSHAHPRVRYSAFTAVGQTAYDHDPYVAETHAETVLPLILAGLDDSNIRVATSSASALASMEDMDEEDLEPHMQELKLGGSYRIWHAIAVVGEAASDLFLPYYKEIMPALKELIANSSKDHQKSLRGKAFECASLLGEGVGKDAFVDDAHGIMQIMVHYIRAGFEADDQTREYVHEAAGRVAGVLGKDFKPYMPALLPSLLKVLQQQPKEVPAWPVPEDDDEFTQVLSDGKLLGLKTAVLDEMGETLQLITALMEALEEEFVEFLPDTCRQLMPLLDFPVSEDVQDKANATWEHVVHCARSAAENGKCEPAIVGQLVGEFLKCTVAMMLKLPDDPKEHGPANLSQLQAQASAMAGVIKKAGVFADCVLKTLLERVQIENEPAEAAPKKKNQGKVDDSDEEESDSDEGNVSRQSVRFSLVDVAGALMRASREEFAEVGLSIFMGLVRDLLQKGSDSERGLALYIADEVVACLGELSVPYWNTFMEHACRAFGYADLGSG